MSEIRDRFITGIKHSLLARVIVTGAAAVQFIAVARILGKEDYGVFRILVNMTQIAGLLAVAGLQGAMVKYVAEFAKSKEDLQKIVSNCLTLNVISSAIICGVFAVLAGVIAVRGYQEPRLTLLILISSATMFVTVVFGQFRSIIQGFQQIPLFAKLTIVQGIATLGCVVTLTWLFGLTGTAIGLLAGAVVLSAVSVPFGLRALKQHGIRFRLAVDKPTMKKMLNYGVPSLLAGLVVIPAFWFGNSVLVWYHGFGELGIFGAALALANLLLILPRALGIPMIPALSELNVETPERAIRVAQRTIRIVVSVATPISLLLCLGSRWLIPVLFGADFVKSATVLPFLLAGVVIQCANHVPGFYLAGIGKMWKALVINFTWFVVYVSIGGFLSARIGSVGLGVAYLMSYAVQTGAFAFCRETRRLLALASVLGAYALLGITFAVAVPLVLLAPGVIVAAAGVGMLASLIAVEYFVIMR